MSDTPVTPADPDDTVRDGARADMPARSRRLTIILGAVVALAIVISVARDRMARGSTADVTAFAATLTTHRVPDDWAAPSWNSSPSDSVPPAVVRAIRVGARLTEFELAAESSDPALAGVGAELGLLADSMSAGTSVVAEYRDRSAALAGSAAAARRESSARALASAAGASLVTTGAWMEAVRVAAMHQDTAFLRSDVFDRGLATARSALRDHARALDAVEDLRTFAAQPAPDWTVIAATIRALFLALS